MNLCSDNHDEVCYDSKQCPACYALKERDEYIQETIKLKDEISDLKDKL